MVDYGSACAVLHIIYLYYYKGFVIVSVFLSLSHFLTSSFSLSLSPSGNCIAILLLTLGGKRLSDYRHYTLLLRCLESF